MVVEACEQVISLERLCDCGLRALTVFFDAMPIVRAAVGSSFGCEVASFLLATTRR